MMCYSEVVEIVVEKSCKTAAGDGEIQSGEMFCVTVVQIQRKFWLGERQISNAKKLMKSSKFTACVEIAASG